MNSTVCAITNFRLDRRHRSASILSLLIGIGILISTPTSAHAESVVGFFGSLFAPFAADDTDEFEWYSDDYYEEDIARGFYASMSEPLIRGQSDYWGTVSQQYATQPPLSSQYSAYNTAYSSPVYVAQGGSANAPPLSTPAASTPPSLGAPTTIAPTTPQPTISASSIAPPLTDITVAPATPGPQPSAPPGQNFFTEPVGTMKRFWNAFSFNYTYLPRGSAKTGLGVNEFNLAGQFAIPCSCMPHANDSASTGYWYISPEFDVELWGKQDLNQTHAPMSMPSSTFKAALGFGARPQFTQDFGADVCVQVGLASSFKKIKKKSFFVRGRGVGTLKINEQISAVGGVVYYGRQHFKLLPAVGVLWAPNANNLWSLVFPNPTLYHFLNKVNETDVWGYVKGDIGGDSWLVSRELGDTRVDYSDYRLGVGLSFKCATGFAGSIEVGGAFGRELYTYGSSIYKPKSSVYLKGGIMY